MSRNLKFFLVCLITMIGMKYILPIGEPVFEQVLLSSSLFSLVLTLFFAYLNRPSDSKNNGNINSV